METLFKDILAKEIYGITLEEAHEQKICIDCKEVVDKEDLSEEEKREYRISGLCPKCFEKI